MESHKKCLKPPTKYPSSESTWFDWPLLSDALKVWGLKYAIYCHLLWTFPRKLFKNHWIQYQVTENWASGTLLNESAMATGKKGCSRCSRSSRFHTGNQPRNSVSGRSRYFMWTSTSQSTKMAPPATSILNKLLGFTTNKPKVFNSTTNVRWQIRRLESARWCPSSLAKLANMTPITMVYGRYNYS